jgi:acyl dehydratase
VIEAGDPIELRVTPDRYVTVRYAGASGDFNPIHIDEEFAREVGLPGRILHGLWTMAQVARAASMAAGEDPTALRSLSVSFRGMGRIGEEIVIGGEVRSVEDGVATARLDAVQGDVRLIKGAVAELRLD